VRAREADVLGEALRRAAVLLLALLCVFTLGAGRLPRLPPGCNSESLAAAAISSRSVNGAATRTGPKISSWTTFMSGVLVSTVGLTARWRQPPDAASQHLTCMTTS
jgi:hypothetical protein